MVDLTEVAKHKFDSNFRRLVRRREDGEITNACLIAQHDDGAALAKSLQSLADGNGFTITLEPLGSMVLFSGPAIALAAMANHSDVSQIHSAEIKYRTQPVGQER